MNMYSHPLIELAPALRESLSPIILPITRLIEATHEQVSRETALTLPLLLKGPSNALSSVHQHSACQEVANEVNRLKNTNPKLRLTFQNQNGAYYLLVNDVIAIRLRKAKRNWIPFNNQTGPSRAFYFDPSNLWRGQFLPLNLMWILNAAETEIEQFRLIHFDAKSPLITLRVGDGILETNVSPRLYEERHFDFYVQMRDHIWKGLRAA